MALPIFNPATDLLMPDADEDEALAPVDDVDAAFMAQIAAATGSGSTGDDSQDAAADEATSDPRGRMEVVELMRAQGVAPRVSTYKALLRSWRGARDGQAAFVVTVVGAMAAARVAPDLELLEMGTAMCARVGGVTEALYFLGQASVLGYAPSEAMYEACVSALAAGGRWQRAADLIRDGEAALRRPLRAESRTLVIRAAGRAGQWRAAVLTLQEMQAGRDRGWREESWPTSQTYAAAISACALSGEWQRGVELLEGMLKGPHALPPSLLAFNAACWRSTEGMLRGPHALPPSLLAFNAAMSACERARQWRKALQLLKQAEGLGLKPDVITYNTAISACAKGGQWNMALGLLATMRNQGVRPDRISYNAAISACASVAGDDAMAFKKAIELLDEMRRRGLKADKLLDVRRTGLEADGFSYSSAIKACARAKDSAKALQLLNQATRPAMCLDASALRPSPVNPLMMHYMNLQSAPSAFGASAYSPPPSPGTLLGAPHVLTAVPVACSGAAAHVQMRVTSVAIDVVAYTSAMDACAATGRWQEGIELLDEMRSKGLQPNERTYRAAIAACGKGGQWQRVLDLLASMRSKGFAIAAQTFNSAVAACEKGGQHAHALALMQQMRAQGTEPDLFTYGSAINACSTGGHWKEALALLEEMRSTVSGPALQPNVICYTAAITAAGRGGEAQLALDLLAQMRADGLTPDAIAFNAVINACRRGGLYHAALETLDAMRAAGHAPDLATITDMVTALEEGGLREAADAV
ncbi:hypothetical protein JKP88DRAFT_350398 [Tribonema minus]|uniref:Pentacotripeptide-repeat region of PRORP domain-containing protein n=1 Tax=Tribonema minus TaxID=303371 RepID=A0A835YNJ5_9STRA|nr:hypothetical protein JKP88DRAFT_350398 [Tribonema minus]